MFARCATDYGREAIRGVVRSSGLQIRHLAQDEQDALVRLVGTVMDVSTIEEFANLLSTAVRQFLDCEACTCAIGTMSHGGPRLFKMIFTTLPIEYIREMTLPDGTVRSPIFANWKKAHSVQIFDPRTNASMVDSAWLAAFRRYELGNLVATAVPDVEGNHATYFSFAGVHRPLGEVLVALLDFLAPHLCVALLKVDARPLRAAHLPCEENHHAILYVRQRQVLQLLAEGRSNSEIGDRLVTTEDNVKYHIKQILHRLHARNRTEAVAKALASGLL